MGLIRFAVRQCAARALRNSTLADDRVFLSVIDPLDTKVKETRAPMLIVNTDDHKQSAEGFDLTGGDHSLDLVVEATIAARVTTTGKDGEGEEVAVTIIEADSGMDLTLDIIEHQITRALLGPDPWAVLLRQFITSVSQRISRRGADASGIRWAARQITITCDTLAEPVGGENVDAGSVWGDFIAAMEADAGLAPMAPLIRGVIEGDGRDWVRSAAMLGISEDVAERVAIAPMVTGEDGQPVQLDVVVASHQIETTQDRVWNDDAAWADPQDWEDQGPAPASIEITITPDEDAE